ncbi:MAG: hypothetical protein K8S27_01725 [Candidatus Omnitrophica bacterium]|nr:hypothetical protein [Candidatus Omnitrophota bacterium]
MTSQEGNFKNIELIDMSSDYNTNDSLFTVIDLRYFDKLRNPTLPNIFEDETTYSNFKSNTVVIEFFESGNNLNPEQVASLREFVINEESISSEVRKVIYKYYNSVYDDYLEGVTMFGELTPEIEEQLPKIVNGNELDHKVHLNSIEIYPSSNGKSKIGLSFWCSWDEEHGLGVLLQGEEVIKVGILHDIAPPF